ncbi:hypothetical protein V6N13_061716 [Hibiscus sabdariffa]|uniref:Uncharacterized protein n=1 Tax=Hibiscus sabdariffa TaxID=183260 RepID=A0ABR1ZP02_9ROSI
MRLAPLSCCPRPCDTSPLARSEHWQLWFPPLPIHLGVHRFPCASTCFYVVVACLSSGLLLCVRPAPSADPWVHVHRCVTCSTLGAHAQWLVRTPSRFTGRSARALSWPLRLPRNLVAWLLSLP